MQLQSILGFLGKDALTSDADARRSETRSSSGFGAMLTSTLALLSHRRDTDAAAEAAVGEGEAGEGEAGRPDAFGILPKQGAVDLDAAETRETTGDGDAQTSGETNPAGSDELDEAAAAVLGSSDESGDTPKIGASGETADVDTDTDTDTDSDNDTVRGAFGRDQDASSGTKPTSSVPDQDAPGSQLDAEVVDDMPEIRPSPSTHPADVGVSAEASKAERRADVDQSAPLPPDLDSSVDEADSASRTTTTERSEQPRSSHTASGKSTSPFGDADAADPATIAPSGDIETAGEADAAREKAKVESEEGRAASKRVDRVDSDGGARTPTSGPGSGTDDESLAPAGHRAGTNDADAHDAPRRAAPDAPGRRTSDRTASELHAQRPAPDSESGERSSIRGAEHRTTHESISRDAVGADDSSATSAFRDEQPDAVRAQDLDRSSRRMSAERIRISREAPASDTARPAADDNDQGKVGATDHRTRPSTERAPESSATTGSARLGTTRAANGAAPNTSGNPVQEAPSASVSDNTEAAAARDSTVADEVTDGTTDADLQSRTVPRTPAADERSARDGRSDSERATGKAASGDNLAASDGAGSQSGGQSDFAGGGDANLEPRFQTIDDLSLGTDEFDGILDGEIAEEFAVGSDVPVDLQTSDSGDELTFAPERAQSTTSSRTVGEMQRLSRPRHAGTLNWLRSMVDDGLSGFSIQDDWKVIEMKLEEGQGTMTVRARRDDEKIAISVNFTDPQLRALALENADRLQESLRSQYQTDVDFSLMSDNGAGQSEASWSDGSQEGRSRPDGVGATPAEPMSAADRARAARAAMIGARNEWIG